MRRPLVTRLVVPSVLVALATASCDAFADDDPSPAPPASAAPSTSPAPTLSAEGYLYTDKQGIRALAAFDGDRGTLEIRNTTGAELAPPGIYLLDARTGAVVEAEVTPSRGLADGQERSFRVALARAMPPASVGLVVLLIGDEDRGAFLPPAARPTP
jgi:hypothetical protein